MPMFRKKPVVIEAMQFLGHNWPQVAVWCNRDGKMPTTIASDRAFQIETLEGLMTASPGDWIIRGIQGELYPCKSDIFEKTYEAVSWIDPDRKCGACGAEHLLTEDCFECQKALNG